MTDEINCPLCDGNGGWSSHAPAPLLAVDPVWVVCGFCEGKGTVEHD